MQKHLYKLRIINSAAAFDPRDGSQVWIDALGNWHLFNGWNPDIFPGGGTNNEHWKSVDNGVTWVKQADCAWTRRHWCGNGNWLNGATPGMILFGGDHYTGAYQKDIWFFNPIGNVFTQLVADWGAGVGNRLGFAWAVSPTAAYIIGGADSITPVGQYFNDIWKYEAGVFSKVCDLPVGLQNRQSAGAFYSNGFIYLTGGGTEGGGGGAAYNDLWKIAADGSSFTKLCTDAKLAATYPRIFIFDNRIVVSKGFSVSGVANMKGVLVSDDNGTTFREALAYTLLANHAAGMWMDNNAIYYASGNMNNLVAKIIRIV